MRALILVAACGLALAAVSAWAAPKPNQPALPKNPAVVQAANGCGAGRHWQPGYRGPYGRWHPGHCVPN